MTEGLIRLEGKVDQLIQADTATGRRIDDHETRLRSLEERRFPHGALSVTAAVLGAVAVVWQAVGR